MRDDILGHRRSGDTAGGLRSPLLTWMLGLTAAVHAVLSIAGVLPGSWGVVPAAVDALLAAGVTAGILAARFLPDASMPPATFDGLATVAIAVSGAVCGVRAAAFGEPWAGGDVVVAVLAAVALPGPGLFLAAVGGAELSWAAVQVTGLLAGTSRLPAYQWVMLAVLTLAPAVAAAVLRYGYQSAVEELAVARRNAGQQAVTDALTGVTNRRGLELMALPMIEHARRQGEAAHCLFIDLDGFRAVNEILGRESGDEVLSAACEAVLASVRATDIVGRWAGDQFVVIGPGTGTSPLEMERRVRGHLTETPPVPQDVWDGRVSIGSATLVPWDEGNIDSLLRRAEEDMQLRRSLRRQSRSRSTVAPVPGVTPPVRSERRANPPKSPPTTLP